MKELLSYIIKGITGREDFTIEETQEEDKLIFNVKADPDYVGLIIGKGGKTIKSIQNIMRVKGRLERKSVYVNIADSS